MQHVDVSFTVKQVQLYKSSNCRETPADEKSDCYYKDHTVE